MGQPSASHFRTFAYISYSKRTSGTVASQHRAVDEKASNGLFDPLQRWDALQLRPEMNNF